MTLKVGIIGAGAIAYDHCKNISQYNGVEINAIAEINSERRNTIKTAFTIPKAYEKWQDLVSDPDINAVVVALPNFLHAPVTLAALQKNKHVLLDKPFALNIGEAKLMAQTARKKNRVLMLAMNQRYRQDSQSLRAIVERGELGEIYHAKTYWYRRTGSPKFGTWFVNKKLSGGGCLLDIGVHYLDLALYLVDNWKPVSVSGAV